jgi:citrate synthase
MPVSRVKIRNGVQKTMSTTAEKQFDQGLVNTIVAETAMSFIDGAKGVLEYVGIEIDALARNSTFEETTYLLWNRRLPNQAELAAFEADLRAEYELPSGILEMIRAMPTDSSPMHALQTLVAALSLFDAEADDNSPEANIRKAIRLVAKTPTLLAAFDRHRKGNEIIAPDSNRSIAGNFLWMLRGEEPTETMTRALDVCLVLHADHGFNASAFTGLVIIATLSDLYSASAGAIGALRGPLHVKGKLERKERIMGFGHRVYKAYDPRATYLKTFAKGLAEDTGNEKLYAMSCRIEELMMEAVGDKGILPNVDFYSATTYWSLGLDLDLFTPLFAVARMSGWTGHCIEYLEDNKLIRPGAAYVGPHDQPYVPVEDR